MKPWIVALALMLGVVGAARAAPVNTGHVEVELIAASTAAPGRTVEAALRQKIAPGWHTYWRNPGSAGEATELKWSLPPGWKASGFTWAAPRRLLLQTLMNYGYEGEVLLPVSLAVPATAKPGSTARLAGEVQLLVCKDQCIPERATLTLDLPVTAAPRPDPRWNGPISAALAAAPRRGPLKAVWSTSGDSLKLAVTGAPLSAGKLGEVYFYPYATDVIDHDAVQRTERGREGVTLTLKSGYAITHGPRPATISGVLEAGGRAWEITAAKGALPASARGLGQIAAVGPGSGRGPGAGASGGGGAGTGGGLGLPMALGLAFLGGVVLNLMPCVFPILSMKALALARHGEDPRGARTGALAFAAGVLACFLALALALILAKAAGAEVGWGFQLQSPLVVAGLALLMMLIGLNLSGVFEAGLGLQAVSGAALRPGLAGSFLTGALAVVVAAPCTAPFMAGAVGFALTQGSGVALLVFAALGLGFAAPFLLLTAVPALARLLPRPGAWMEGLRKVLAFPMYGAAAWLLWVLTLQAGTTAMAGLLAAGVVLALAAWIYGAGQRAGAAGRRTLPAYGASGLAALAAMGLAIAAARAPARAAAAGSGALQAEAFTPTRVAELQAQGRPVFVDFTAAWCVTCQVNERVALSTAEVAAAFRRTNAAYVKADWTRQDPAIAEALAAHGRAGVPLYLVYAGGGGEPQILPQLLSQDMVIRALDRAAKS